MTARRFRYGLEAILATRRWASDAAERELGEANLALAQHEQRLAELRRRLDAAPPTGALGAIEFANRYRHRMAAAAAIAAAQRELAELEGARDAAARRAVEAARALDVFEKDRRAKRTQHGAALAALAAREADDHWLMHKAGEGKDGH